MGKEPLQGTWGVQPMTVVCFLNLLWEIFFPLSQFRLFCRHPSSNERLEKRIEVHIDTTLSETVAMAHKV